MSPTVSRIGPYRFFFFSNEGREPPHIHVQRDNQLAKYWLDPVELAASTGFGAHELSQVRELVETHSASFKEAWNEFFGY